MTNRTLLLLLLAGGVATCLACAIALQVGPVDDTYIFLRYARNVAHGLGPVFNSGQRVEGYTSPVWTAILSALAFLQVDLAATSVLLSGLLGAAAIVVVMLMVLRFGRGVGTGVASDVPAWTGPATVTAALGSGLYLALSPPFVYWTWSGMETALFAFLFVLCFVLFVREVYAKGPMWGSGVCLALLALTRLDGLSVLPVYLLAIYVLGRGWGTLAAKYTTFVAPLAGLVLHFLWRYSYYGMWLPNTFYAKADLPFGLLLTTGLSYTAEFSQTYWPLLLLVVAGLVVAARRPRSVTFQTLALGCGVALAWAGYATSVGGDHFAMYRFFVPLLPLLSLLAALASLAIAYAARELRVQRSASGSRTGRFAVRLALCYLPVVAVLMQTVTVYSGFQAALITNEVFMPRLWADMSAWMVQAMPESTRIGTVTIGTVPYYTGFYTYDLVGLTDTQISLRGKFNPASAPGHQKYNTDYILAQKPDCILYSWAGRITGNPTESQLTEENYYYFNAMNSLLEDSRTPSLYEPYVERMPNGTYFGCLRLKSGS